jgi:hypothetical protein
VQGFVYAETRKLVAGQQPVRSSGKDISLFEAEHIMTAAHACPCGVSKGFLRQQV